MCRDTGGAGKFINRLRQVGLVMSQSRETARGERWLAEGLTEKSHSRVSPRTRLKQGRLLLAEIPDSCCGFAECRIYEMVTWRC